VASTIQINRLIDAETDKLGALSRWTGEAEPSAVTSVLQLPKTTKTSLFTISLYIFDY